MKVEHTDETLMLIPIPVRFRRSAVVDLPMGGLEIRCCEINFVIFVSNLREFINKSIVFF